MSGLYPDIDRWVIPRTLLAKTSAVVLAAGHAGRETGVFWLGERSSTATMSAIVVPAGEGVEERPEQWRVSSSVFGAISLWAKPRDLVLLAIAHIHLAGVPVVLSWADRNLSVQVPGILAIVIGNGGADREYADWGWYVYERTDYRKMTSAELEQRLDIQALGRFSTWRADARSVYEEDL